MVTPSAGSGCPDDWARCLSIGRLWKWPEDFRVIWVSSSNASPNSLCRSLPAASVSARWYGGEKWGCGPRKGGLVAIQCTSPARGLDPRNWRNRVAQRRRSDVGWRAFPIRMARGLRRRCYVVAMDPDGSRAFAKVGGGDRSGNRYYVYRVFLYYCLEIRPLFHTILSGFWMELSLFIGGCQHSRMAEKPCR